MKNNMFVMILAFAAGPLFATTQTCTNESLAAHADAELPHTPAELSKELKIEGATGRVTWTLDPDTIEVTTKNAPHAKGVQAKQKDEYSIQMTDSAGYTVPVYIWTSAGKCRISAKSVHVDADNGDDG